MPALPDEFVGGRLTVPVRKTLPAEKSPKPSRDTIVLGALALVAVVAIVSVLPDGVIVTLLPGLRVTPSVKPLTLLTTWPEAMAPPVTALAAILEDVTALAASSLEVTPPATMPSVTLPDVPPPASPVPGLTWVIR